MGCSNSSSAAASLATVESARDLGQAQQQAVAKTSSGTKLAVRKRNSDSKAKTPKTSQTLLVADDGWSFRMAMDSFTAIQYEESHLLDFSSGSCSPTTAGSSQSSMGNFSSSCSLQPLAPDMEMTEEYCQKLDQFLADIASNPSFFVACVHTAKRRSGMEPIDKTDSGETPAQKMLVHL
mmetsp:Transcript_62772/g.149782  ORF Transcript_62772/g.149782 Transcript_62772/m.149782 type:complete len:179 (-) Transcript_62772:146-682(-)|eukprot:CAMPEP_0178413656 /NCGR_PEP_ID=MMETSP0689_2-20121128/22640_1 /TAXON_ID=160604 /ORGANISM="Amphidinium massartii, Strain CS-259" /LENGTH=178 /DNA_ID=CAMNT_0020034935 /DNA_START=58 /DNA_END=594 /DNA_ORIENTATION=-